MELKKIQKTSIMSSFSILPDPRKERNQEYTLFEIITIAILGVLCGADDWVSISAWGEANQEWLQKIGLCKKGVPSHDTFSRFFRYVDSKAFEECFIQWTQKIAKAFQEIIALDGKTLRSSKEGNEKAIHIVSAFAVKNDLILGQLATEKKSNEITAFPLLLKILDLENSIVTIDAAGCQKDIAKIIIQKKGDYLLAVKGNQKKLFDELGNFFDQAIECSEEEVGYDYYSTEEKSRNRIEKREVWTVEDLEWLSQKKDWEGLKTISCIKSTRTYKEKTSIEFRYYISSLSKDAKRIAEAIRGHWGVENKLHWQLDVSYNEDKCKVRKDNGAENFSVLRRATLNLLKKDKKTKAGIANKRLKAGWSKKYLLEVLDMA